MLFSERVAEFRRFVDEELSKDIYTLSESLLLRGLKYIEKQVLSDLVSRKYSLLAVDFSTNENRLALVAGFNPSRKYSWFLPISNRFSEDLVFDDVYLQIIRDRNFIDNNIKTIKNYFSGCEVEYMTERGTYKIYI